jgi:ABC-type branched-subunit amino acid transport system ATPase component/branched-subunit amino acid ABC-type transport system permease component
MSDLLPFLIAGITTGAVYGMAGVGLVLTYKTSGVFNFAHGALATVAAYAFYVLAVEHDVPWPVAAFVAVFVLGPLLGLGLELLARSVQTAGLAIQVATTVGLLVAIESAVQLIFGNSELREVPVFLGTSGFTIDGATVQVSDLLTLAVAILITGGLSVYFRIARGGAEMRAVVDDPELLATFGTSPVRTRRRAWMVGTTIACASGVLFAPLLPLDPVQLTLLVVAAFGAAAIGGFTNMPLTLAGGLGIGVLASFSTKWFVSGALAGIPPSLPFIVLFVALLVFPKRYLVGGAFTPPRPRPTWLAPVRFRWTTAAVLLVALAVVPTFAGVHITAWTSALGTAIVFLSLGLLVRSSGQVSLCHISFAAIGAVAFSHLAGDQGVPWLPALLLAGLIAVPIGAVLAIPAIRLSGLYLALATFGFGVLLQYMFYGQSYMFGDSGIGLNAPRPGFAQGDTGFYYVALGVAAVLGLAVVLLNRGRLGRLMRGMADAPTVLTTSGATVNTTRVMVFCLSAFIAAIGGAVAASGQGTISAESYAPLTSLEYFVLVMIVAGGELWAAALAAVALIVVPAYITGSTVGTVLQLIFGVSAIVVGLLPASAQEMPAPLRAVIDRVFGGRRRGAEPAAAPGPAGSVHDRVDSGALALRAVEVRFGGLVAVDGVSLDAPTGRITGLIGPNGAGKSTIFNATSGLLRPRAGDVLLDGRAIGRLSTAERSRQGIGRTFQKMALFESLPVWDNVAIGAEAALAGKNPVRHVAGSPHATRHVAAATAEALALCELADLRDRPVGSLSTGQRRLVELARCLAGDFRFLLLDEPSSGLDHAETERFGRILRGAVQQRGLGILMVEHDMSLVLDVCEHIYVVDFGKLIFEGTPAEVQTSTVVKTAYLGDATPGALTAVQR